MIWLTTAFFITALLYASVGFGGGSTYSAVLAMGGVDYRILPLISLACNLVVVTGGTIRFARAGVLPWRRAVGVTALAAPLAFLGGLTPIAESRFLLLLGLSLVLSGLAMLVPTRCSTAEPTRYAKFAPALAAPLGYLAGLVGIGGGIFLAPLLHLTRWADARAIAATASFFILVNSLFGLAGQIMKGGGGRFEAAIGVGLPLLLAVAIGGQVGSLLALRYLSVQTIRGLTGLLVSAIGIRLLAT